MLYRLTNDIERLNDAIEDNGGEIPPDVEAELSALAVVAEERIESLAIWIRNLEAEAKADREEAAFFAKRAQARENLAARIRAGILKALQVLGRDSLVGGRFRVAARVASTPTIRWAGFGPIPEAFARTVTETTLDVKAARVAEKAGTLPEGFEVKRTAWLDIR